MNSKPSGELFEHLKYLQQSVADATRLPPALLSEQVPVQNNSATEALAQARAVYNNMKDNQALSIYGSQVISRARSGNNTAPGLSLTGAQILKTWREKETKKALEQMNISSREKYEGVMSLMDISLSIQHHSRMLGSEDKIERYNSCVLSMFATKTEKFITVAWRALEKDSPAVWDHMFRRLMEKLEIENGTRVRPSSRAKNIQGDSSRPSQFLGFGYQGGTIPKGIFAHQELIGAPRELPMFGASQVQYGGAGKFIGVDHAAKQGV